MFKQLPVLTGKNVTVELVNGRIVSGAVLAVHEQYMCVETAAGVGTVPIKAIQIIWEPLTPTQTEKSMERLAEKLRDSVKAEISGTGPQFTCSQQYIGRPPDFCPGSFACPGRYVPGACGTFQFGSQCSTPWGYRWAEQKEKE